MNRAPRLRSAKLWHAFTCVALAAIWLAMLLLGRGWLDRAAAQAFYAGGHPALVATARAFTALGNPTVLIVGGFVVACWLWWRRRGRFALGLLLLILIGRGLTEVQKLWIVRARPEVEPHLVLVKTWSFPSGHAASSMIVFLTLALALAKPRPWRRIAVASALLLSLLIGISRVMLGVHWPSDVIGGWAFGMLWVLLTLPRTERLFAPHSTTMPKQL
jgi:undecaprenyl-diphosphatase